MSNVNILEKIAHVIMGMLSELPNNDVCMFIDFATLHAPN